MTKPTKRVCAQRRLSSAWASAQSDQSLRCPHEETLGSLIATLADAQADLGTQSLCWFCYVAANFVIIVKYFCYTKNFSSACFILILFAQSTNNQISKPSLHKMFHSFKLGMEM